MADDVLPRVSSPADLADLTYAELDRLAFELRAHMVAATSRNGGHLAPSLGATELVIALHRAYDCPRDKIVYDVGHQAYAHKLICGRRDDFKTLRTAGGVSGFPKIGESPYDAHDSGHASDALSTAYGYCIARDIDGTSSNIAALVGDASFVGGMSMEALNNIGTSGTRLVIVLNDNGMSISPSVGGVAAHLARVRSSGTYLNIRTQVEEAFEAGGKLGRAALRTGNLVKESLKRFFLPGDTFLEGFGVTYLGPIDGHDIPTLEAILVHAKRMDGPVVVHAVTAKGKGYPPAEADPSLFHGVAPFDIRTGKLLKSGSTDAAAKRLSWTDVFGEELVKIAAGNRNVVAVTAAMTDGTGLTAFSKRFPSRFFDVGIAEEHAVGMAASLALAGKTPVVAIYSTFLQRAFDQIVINCALPSQHVVFAVDRAGVVGADGPTHHGAFDLAYLRCVPGMRILAPSNAGELRAALRWAVYADGPVAVRYHRGTCPEGEAHDAGWQEGKGVKVRAAGSGGDAAAGGSGAAAAGESGAGGESGAAADVALLAVGDMVGVALGAADILAERGVAADVWDMRWVKPIDDDAVREACATGHVITIEDGTRVGGFGSAVLESAAAQSLSARIDVCGLPDEFIGQGTVSGLLAEASLTPEDIAALA